MDHLSPGLVEKLEQHNWEVTAREANDIGLTDELLTLAWQVIGQMDYTPNRRNILEDAEIEGIPELYWKSLINSYFGEEIANQPIISTFELTQLHSDKTIGFNTNEQSERNVTLIWIYPNKWLVFSNLSQYSYEDMHARWVFSPLFDSPIEAVKYIKDEQKKHCFCDLEEEQVGVGLMITWYLMQWIQNKVNDQSNKLQAIHMVFEKMRDSIMAISAFSESEDDEEDYEEKAPKVRKQNRKRSKTKKSKRRNRRRKR